jgi:hypothetical protein
VRKPLIGLLTFVGLVAVVVVVAYWLSRPETISATPPKGTPAAGSCWNVDEKAAAITFPWPGSAVDCTARHTAEVFYVGQVDRKLAAKAAGAKGDDAKISQSLMYAEARRGCVVAASAYLGGDWHTGRVQVIADWVRPARTGHFGCALAEVAAPASKRLVARTASLRGAMKGGALAVGCVARDGDTMAYSSCDQPHDGEFVGTYTITPPDAPFDAAKVRAAAASGCEGLTARYVGASRTDLRSGYVGPATAGDWLGSDQTYTCYALVAGDGKLRGSLKGVGSGPLPH